MHLKLEWLDRFTEVMNVISENANEGVGVSELSRNINLSKSTVHRMLSGMISHELVIQENHTKKYFLGPKAMIWGSQYLRSQDPSGLMGRYCGEISNKTGLYSYLCSFQRDEVYCIYTHQPSNLRNKYFVHVGQRMPYHSSAAAKVILAYQEPELIDLLLDREPFTSITPFTISNKNDLENEFKQVVREEVAFCHQELELGVSAISVPIFYEKKKTKMSLSIVGESALIETKQEELSQDLKEVSQEASKHLKSMYLLSSVHL